MTDESANLKDAERVIGRLREKLADLRERRREAIAIVGVAARTPFESHGVTAWEGLSRGIDASRGIPSDRWDVDAFYDPNPQVAGKIATKRGSFLAEVASFDAAFFGISPVEAQAMDPQQRIVLETVWDALADAGASLAGVQQIQTGVFLGLCGSDYATLVLAGPPSGALAPYVGTGNAASVVAGRVSYALGLTGPSFVVDTACSSSLVALHLACESLRAGTSDVALAGGVNLMLAPHSAAALSNLGALSADGRCRTFDATGTGYGRGEGCVVVVLKRLTDAVRDGDRIFALVRGSAVNQDGRSDGLTAPNGLAQQQVIRKALEFAKISPGDVQYVEAHGTGTVLGDPIEVDALSEVFRARPTKSSPLAIGSVKSNIGHLEAAAGISGLLKVVLSIQHRELPPSLHFQRPNPHIPWERIPLRVQTTLGPWPEPDKPLVAGVSSFGFSGTNAHVVVSEPPPEAEDAWREADRLAAEAQVLPLCVSAKTPEALRAYAKRFAEHLSSPLEAPATWRDVAFTSSVRRTHLEHRLVVIGTSAAEWSEKLLAFANGETRRGLVAGEANDQHTKVIFVFPGQGSQWLGMGSSLLASSPVFREHIERCEQAFRPHVDWSLREQLTADALSSRMGDIDVVQPMLFAVQTGLAAVWASVGVVPYAVLGHSMGEVAAAFVAGALKLEDAARVICIRSKLLRRVRGRGAMAAVEMSMAEIEGELSKYEGKISVAASNGARTTVVSGDTAAITALLESLKQRDIFCRLVKVDVASHSSQVDELKTRLLEDLTGLRPTAPAIRFVSTCVVEPNVEPRLDAAYWWANLREPVRLSQRVDELIGAGHRLFVEVSPHPVLAVALEEALRAAGVGAPVVASLRREEPEAAVINEALGALHAAGYPIDWKRLLSVPGRVVSLPSYPWQRERYWLPVTKKPKGRSSSKWALLHSHMVSSDQPGKHVFEAELELDDALYAYLSDHVVEGVWLPGAAFLEMALQGAATAFEGREVSVDDVALSQAPMIGDGEAVVVQLVLSPEQEGASRFRIASRPAKEKTAAWTEHASGRLVLGRAHVVNPACAPLGELRKRCTRALAVGEFYDDLDDAGNSHGQSLRPIARAWAGDGEVLAELVPVAELTEHEDGHVLHPLVLEAALQTVAAATAESSAHGARVVSTVGSLSVAGKNSPRWVHVTSSSATDEAVESDARLLDDEGLVVAELRVLRSTPSERAARNPRNRVFEVVWRTSMPNAPESADGRWLLLADSQGVASALRSWLEARGASVVTVARGKGYTKEDATHYALDPLVPDALHRLMKEAFDGAPPKHVVHLWTLDVRQPDAPLTEDAVRRVVELGCVSGLNLVHAIDKSGWRQPPRLFLVTRGCQAATSSLDVAMPEQALLWGYGAVLEHEMPGLRTKLVDLDVNEIAHDAFAIELTRADDEQRVALRGGARRVARLTRTTGRADSQARLDPDKTYLVTDGREGSGLAVAERLTKLGAKHLVLFASDARRPTHAALERLARSGAVVDVVDVDVDVPGAFERAVAELERTRKPLAGVFHAIGVDEDGPLSSLSPARIATALAPSVLGALWLDRLVSAPGPFVLYSSVSSALVSAGESNKTAASAFFDALAHYRARSAGHAVSIHWSPTLGFGSVSDDAELFGRLLASPSAHAAVIDFRQWRRASSHLRPAPFWQDLVSSGNATSRSTDPVFVQALLRDLLKQSTSRPNVGEDTNLLDGVLDSLGAVSFLRSVEKAFGLHDLTSRVRAKFRLSLHALTTLIVSLASGQEAAPEARKRSIVLPDPARRPPRATKEARRYGEVFGADGLRSTVWEADGGISLEVLEQGSGPCLLLLPPFACETPVWLPFLRHLQTPRRIITPNLPGYGRTPLPADLSLEAVASALLAVLEVIDPSHPVDVVGWSIGGFIAQMLAAAVPTRFRTMTLVNTTSHLGLGSFEDYEKIVVQLGEDLNSDLAIAERPAELERLVSWDKESRATAVIMTYSGLIQSFDARSTSSAITTPTLVVAGEKDLLTPVSMATRLQESIQGSRLEVIRNVGHYAPLFRPEEFARLVAGHLDPR